MFVNRDLLRVTKQVLSILAFAFLGYLYIHFNLNQIEKDRITNILQTSTSIEASLPKDIIITLNADPNDIQKKEYWFIKNLLKQIIEVNKDVRFVYIYTQKGDKLYFIVDSEPENSKNYSPAGQEYTEASSEYKQPFIDGKELFTRSTTDRWGTWRSALIPIKDKNTGKIFAVFGMDFNSNTWNTSILYEGIESGVLVVLLLFLVLILLRIKTRNNKYLNEILHHKRTEQALTDTKEQYKLIADKMTDVVWLMDLKGKSIYVSPSITQFTGYTPEEYLQQSIDERFTKNSAVIAKRVLEKELSTHLAASIELLKNFKLVQHLEYVCKNNQPKWGELLISPYFGPNNQLVGIHGVTRDITLRRQSEENLTNSLALMEATIESTENGILVVDAKGSVIKANNRFTEMWTIPSELLSQSEDEKLLEHIHYQLSDPNSFLEKVKQLYSEPHSESFDLLEFKDGRIFERLSKPMLVNGEAKGRVWSFRDITKQHRSEELLHNERTLFRTVIDLIPDAIYVKDTEGRKILANPKEIELTGKNSEAETIGKTDIILHSREVAEHSQKEDQFILTTGESILDIESNLVDRDGKIHTLRGSKVPLRDIHGNITGIVGVNHDITEQKRAEKEITMLANAMKSINECVSITDMEDRLIFVNESFLKTYGFTEAELIGKNVSIFHSPNTPYEIVERILPSTLKGRWEGELLNIRKDGSEFPIYLSTAVIHNSVSEPIALIGVSTDITDRKKAEELLKFEEERYRTLVENIGEGIGYVDPDEVFVFANPVAENIFGVIKGGLVGRNLKDFISEEQFATVRSQTHARQQGKRSSYELEFTRSDGEIRNLLVSAVPQFDDNGIFIGAYGVFRDITNRKLAELTIQQKNQELQALNITKDKFFSIIAHDLKSPFNTLLGLSELLAENLSTYDEETLQTIVTNLYSTTVNTHKLLENLLDWARNQQNRIEYNPTKIDLFSVANDIIQLLKPTADAKNISLILNISSPFHAMADTYMINAVMRNLISNAIKFTSSKGFVRINAENKENMVLVSIEDNGIGIKPENILQLFRIDTNVSQEGTSGEKGTGLGLLLCMDFVKKHGGNLWVESEIGKGSTFFFTLNQIN
jgi:PAS domain S-box-containing protein